MKNSFCDREVYLDKCISYKVLHNSTNSSGWPDKIVILSTNKLSFSKQINLKTQMSAVLAISLCGLGDLKQCGINSSSFATTAICGLCSTFCYQTTGYMMWLRNMGVYGSQDVPHDHRLTKITRTVQLDRPAYSSTNMLTVLTTQGTNTLVHGARIVSPALNTLYQSQCPSSSPCRAFWCTSWLK